MVESMSPEFKNKTYELDLKTLHSPLSTPWSPGLASTTPPLRRETNTCNGAISTAVQQLNCVQKCALMIILSLKDIEFSIHKI